MITPRRSKLEFTKFEIIGDHKAHGTLSVVRRLSLSTRTLKLEKEGNTVGNEDEPKVLGGGTPTSLLAFHL